MSLLQNLAARVRRPVGNPDEEQNQDVYSDTYLMDKVMNMDSQPQTSRVGGEYLHVSSLISMCVRKHVLAYVSKAERTEVVKPSMRIVWALGRAAENHVRTQFIDAMNYEGIVGMWKCSCGHLKVQGLYNDTLKCPKCSKKAKKYNEASVFDHEYRIVGSPDLLYIRPDNKKIMVVECKSINKKDFDLLTRPKMDHILQAACYNRLLEKEGVDVDKTVTILYVCKDFSFTGSPYKEFRVPVNTADVSFSVIEMWSKARQFAEQKKNHDEKELVTYPNRLPMCSSRDSTFAKDCSFCGMCFSVR